MPRITRKQHEAGVEELNKRFNWNTTSATNPRQGDPEFVGRRARRRRGKAARLSRKRNR